MSAGSGIVVGIDPSLTSTGVARLDWGNPVALNVFGRQLRGQKSYQSRGDRMTFTLSQVLGAVPRNAELVVIEGMSYDSNLPGHHDIVGLWWHIFTHLHARGAAIAVIPPPTLKVWATGRASEKINGKINRTDKGDMLAAAREQFADVADSIRNGDMADALHAASCGAAWLGHPLPFTRRRDRFSVDAVAWPTLPTCPDCGHDSRATQGTVCVAIVERNGKREHCRCTALARPANIPPTHMTGTPT